jgi:hypothetical protein
MQKVTQKVREETWEELTLRSHFTSALLCHVKLCRRPSLSCSFGSEEDDCPPKVFVGCTLAPFWYCFEFNRPWASRLTIDCPQRHEGHDSRRGQMVLRIGVWQGAVMASLKFHSGLRCPTLVSPAVGSPLKRLFQEWSTRKAAVFYPLGYPTRYAYGLSWAEGQQKTFIKFIKIK